MRRRLLSGSNCSNEATATVGVRSAKAGVGKQTEKKKNKEQKSKRRRAKNNDLSRETKQNADWVYRRRGSTYTQKHTEFAQDVVAMYIGTCRDEKRKIRGVSPTADVTGSVYSNKQTTL